MNFIIAYRVSVSLISVYFWFLVYFLFASLYCYYHCLFSFFKINFWHLFSCNNWSDKINAFSCVPSMSMPPSTPSCPYPRHVHEQTSLHCVWPVMTFTVFCWWREFSIIFRWMKVYTTISICRPLYSIRQQAFTLYFVLLFVSAVSAIVNWKLTW